MPEPIDYGRPDPRDATRRGCLIALLVVAGMLLLVLGYCATHNWSIMPPVPRSRPPTSSPAFTPATTQSNR